MDTELLKTFLEVSRTRHFGRAAENLYISQSAVSARIRQLEELVGVALFTRARNDIQLTPAGQKLIGHAERILTNWNRARQEIVAEDEHHVPLAVAGVPSLWDIALQDWLHWLHRTVSGVAPQAEVLSQDVVMRRLLDGSLDLGFLFESPQLTQLEVRQIFQVPLVMVASRPDLGAEQAMADGYLLVDWGTSFAISHARHFPDMPPPALRVNLGRMAQSYLLECGGAAYLARPAVEQHLVAGRLFLVDDAPEIDRLAYAVYPARSNKLETVEALLEYFSRKRPTQQRPAR